MNFTLCPRCVVVVLLLIAPFCASSRGPWSIDQDSQSEPR
jgi:hypothetical protein